MSEPRKPDVYVAIPTVRDWKREFGVSMVGLSIHLCKLSRQGVIKGFRFDNHQTSNLPKLRQKMLDSALASGCTHILFIDDDQSFPPECLDIMLKKDKPWLVANICKKDGSGWIASYGEGRKVDSTGKTGCEQIATMGLGFALINLDAIRHIPKPHFEMVWMESAGEYMGEDIYFNLKAKHSGVEIWVDHDASNLITHIGNYGFGAHDFAVPRVEAAA